MQPTQRISLFPFKWAYHNAFFALCLVIHEWLFEFWTLAQKFWKTNGIVLKEQNTWKFKPGCQQGSATGWRGGCRTGGHGHVGRCTLWPCRRSGPCSLQLRGLFLCCLFSQDFLPEFCPGQDGQMGVWLEGRNSQSSVCGEAAWPRKGPSCCCTS